jgi:dTDP-glucose pyrophosphorylase
MNTNKINLIMPMGGAGTRFFNNGYESPKPLLEINGKPFFFWATESINKFLDLKSLSFVVLQEHIDCFQIDQKIHEFYPEAQIVVLNHVMNGAVLTCREGIKVIDNDAPVLFNDCDHLFKSSSFTEFLADPACLEIDGALLTFESNDPKFSFVKLDEQNNVVGTVEKVVVSNQAICGAYYFKNKELFMEATEEYLHECAYKEFFVSGLYNILVKKEKFIKHFEVDFHLPFGTPEEYYLAKSSLLFAELL